MMILKMSRIQGRASVRWRGMKWLAGNISRQRCFSIHKELGIYLESRHQAIFSSNSNLELLTLLKRDSCVKNISFQLCQPTSSSPLSLWSQGERECWQSKGMCGVLCRRRWWQYGDGDDVAMNNDNNVWIRTHFHSPLSFSSIALILIPQCFTLSVPAKVIRPPS